MIAPLVLLLLALVLSIAGPRFLLNATWSTRSPALGILAWQALSASIFGSIVLAGLSLAVPEIPASEGLANFVQACSAALRDHYATPGGAALSLAGGALAAGLVARLLLVLARDLLAVRRDRSRQHDLLSLVCQPHHEPNVVVVEHERAAVYCLPGRRRQIVVTRGALDALSSRELAQVLAHERAHLRAHHHLALLVAGSLSTCFRGRLGFAIAREQIAELAEMHADDAAAHDMRSSLASALIALAGAARPTGALSASGGTALLRIERLLAPAKPVSRTQRHLVVMGLALAFVLPVLIATAPAVSALAMDYCPVLLP